MHIQYAAPVRGLELTTRAELLEDIPDHPSASLEYYKIQLGPVISLPRPMRAIAWCRITFFYTTGDLVLSSETISDLILSGDERQLLWQALRERSSQMEAYWNEPLPEIVIDPEVLAELPGIADAE